MNILFISQVVPYPPHGGVLQRGYNLLRQISKRNNVHLLAFIHPDTLPNENSLEEAYRKLGRFCNQVEFFPLWVKKSRAHFLLGTVLGIFSVEPFSVIAHRSKRLETRISEIMKSSKFDLVHFDTVGLAQFGKGHEEVPCLLTHHNIESKLLRRRAEVEKLFPARWYLSRQAEKLQRYENQKAKKFGSNIMVSELDAQEIKLLIPGVKTSVVSNGVDLEYFSPRQENESEALIYTGGMNMFANRDAVSFFVKEILPIIRNAIPSVEFYAIGQNPPSHMLEMASKDDRIKVPGYVDDIRPYVNRAQVYVVPLRVGGGTRLKILDAMAMGKAIVSTSVGCEGLDVSPGSNIIVADDPEKFAAKTIEALKDRAMRAKLGKAARKLVQEKYSWERIGEQLQEVYESVYKEKRKGYTAQK